MHVCVGSIDSQKAKWMLMKLCRHYPWVPSKVSTKRNTENVTPGGGKGIFNFSFIKAIKKNHCSVIEHRSLKLNLVVQTWTKLIFSPFHVPSPCPLFFPSFFLSFIYFLPPTSPPSQFPPYSFLLFLFFPSIFLFLFKFWQDSYVYKNYFKVCRLNENTHTLVQLIYSKKRVQLQINCNRIF